MTKYTIYNESAFDWLAAHRKNSVRGVVTDPPYAIVEYSKETLHKLRNGNGGIWRLPQSYDGFARQSVPRFTVLLAADYEKISAFHAQLAPLLLKVLVPGAHVFMASQNLLSHLVTIEFVRAGFQVRGQIARVVKTLRGGDRPKGAHKTYKDISVTPRSCWEPWLIFRKPCEGRVSDNLAKWSTGALRRPAEHAPFMDLIEASPASRAERAIAPHPSLKPQLFLRQIVRAALPLGKGPLLDPFMGSGSTIAASCALEIESIGIEVDREYFMLAQKAIPDLANLEDAKRVKQRGRPNGRP